MENESVFERIVSLIKKEAMIRKYDFTLETRIEKDLGVTGDDAAELIEAFAKEFQVDVSRFVFHDYFGPEGTDIFCQYPDAQTRKKLTIGDLEEAVELGKLV